MVIRHYSLQRIQAPIQIPLSWESTPILDLDLSNEVVTATCISNMANSTLGTQPQKWDTWAYPTDAKGMGGHSKILTASSVPTETQAKENYGH